MKRLIAGALIVCVTIVLIAVGDQSPCGPQARCSMVPRKRIRQLRNQRRVLRRSRWKAKSKSEQAENWSMWRAVDKRFLTNRIVSLPASRSEVSISTEETTWRLIPARVSLAMKRELRRTRAPKVFDLYRRTLGSLIT